ncbi:MAG TPA: helix-turn-helix domain-containing protein [Candidatus Nitrosocosmicus sp.]|nr:helix-turn-helix domain-containing protein [Candidatus Nitrosocosmicus sp.]
MNTLRTTEEICKILKVRRETLFKWRKYGLPFKRIMGVIRYDLEEVAAWVLSQNGSRAAVTDISLGGEKDE